MYILQILVLRYRIAEINVFGMLYDKFPYSLPFGFGSGYYSMKLCQDKGGISQGNYRVMAGFTIFSLCQEDIV